MAQRELSGIIFDFNGVIIDDYLLQKESWSQMAQILRGRPVTDDEMVHRIRGVPSKDTIVWLSTKALNSVEIKAFVQRKTNIIHDLFETSPLLQLATGLPTFLDELTVQNIARTIATSQTHEAFSYLFDKLDLAQWFDKELVVCFDGTYPGKPAPDAYILAAHSIRLEPKACVVVEDAASGIAAAWAAGVQSIVVVGRTEHLQEFSLLPGVTKAIHNFSEIHAHDLFSS